MDLSVPSELKLRVFNNVPQSPILIIKAPTLGLKNLLLPCTQQISAAAEVTAVSEGFFWLSASLSYDLGSGLRLLVVASLSSSARH